MVHIAVAGEPQALDLERRAPYDDHFVLSPYVMRTKDGYEMLVRLVNRDEDAEKKVSRIHRATSDDGVRFVVDPKIVIDPSPSGPDDGGCEDPTVAHDGKGYVVFYSGYERERRRSAMLAAAGPSTNALTKRGVVLPDERYENPKEAAMIATRDGVRMYFEYAKDGASLIGAADAASLDGPWRYGDVQIGQRPGHFDAWHLSPSSSIRLSDGRHVLFYNGSTKKTDWRIGYAVLDPEAREILERSETPLVSTFDVHEGDTDIAFAASAVVERHGRVWLYYSMSDRRLLRIALDVEGAVADSAMR